MAENSEDCWHINFIALVLANCRVKWLRILRIVGTFRRSLCVYLLPWVKWLRILRIVGTNYLRYGRGEVVMG